MNRLGRIIVALSLIFQNLVLAGAAFFALFAAQPSLSQAASPVMNFQGRLTNTSNNPQTGSFDFKFRLFDAPSGGNQLWPAGGVTEDQTLPVTNGVFSAQVGAVMPIPLSAFQVGDGTDVYLEIQVQGETLSPRQKMLTVPFAMTLMGRTTSDFVNTGSVDQVIGGSKTFTSDASFNGTITVPVPSASGHAANKGYVDGLTGGGQNALNVSGSTQSKTGSLSLGGSLTVAGAVSFSTSIALGSGLNAIHPMVQVNSSARTLRFGNSTSASDEGFQFFNLDTNTNLLMVQQSGNIGIGTTNPVSRLAIDLPSALGSSNAIGNGIVIRAGNTANGLEIRHGSSTGFLAINPDSSGTGALGLGTKGAYPLYFYTNAGLNAGTPSSTGIVMAMTSAGNVGIGTVSPTSRLDVNGLVQASSASFTTTGASASNVGLRVSSSSYLGTSGGLTGVATSSPKAVFSVSTSDSDMLNIYSNANNQLSIQTTLDNQSIGTYGGGQNMLNIQPVVGTVSIGTTGNTATKLLVVDSDNNATADIGQFFANNLTQGLGLGYNRIEAVGSSANQDILLLPKGTGNVGIGTTSPGQKLQVGSSGVASSSGLIRAGTCNADCSGNRYWEFGVTSDDYHFRIADQGNGRAMTIRWDNLNVGIGSPNPALKLDVVGDIRASAGMYLGTAGYYFSYPTAGWTYTNASFYSAGSIAPSNQNTYAFSYAGSGWMYTNGNFYAAGLIAPSNQTSYYMGVTGAWLYTNANFYASGLIAPENQTSYYIRNAGNAISGAGIYTNGGLYSGGHMYPSNQASYFFAYTDSAWTYTNGNFYSAGHLAPSGQRDYFFYYNGGGQLRTNGGLIVDGAMSKGSGSFDIAHPDPAKSAEGYRLRHYFVESPTAGDNLYRWRIEVKNKEAVIVLPDYFHHLNENVFVWVSPDEHFGRAYGKINADLTKVTIKADQDGAYYVLAVGTRKDKLAKEDFDKYGLEYIRKNTPSGEPVRNPLNPPH